MNCNPKSVEKVARRWTHQQLDPHLRETGRVTPTEFQVKELRLPVSDARFDRAMDMAARDMGGTYNRNTGVIHLPKDLARPGDRTFPTEIQVMYRKFPCGFIIKDVRRDSPAAGLPCVSFDVVPNVPGDPRRSRIYQSFKGEAATSKTLFGKFLGWLKIVSRAVKRYRQQVEQGRPATFGRLASEELPESQVERVARLWLVREARGSR